MRAESLIEDFPLVHLDTPALDAVRLLGERHLTGLVVVDEHQHLVTILAGYHVLRFVIPRYVLADPALAAVMDEQMADQLVHGLGGKTVADVLPDPPGELYRANPDDTVMELATLMASNHTQIIAIMDGNQFRGVVTSSALFALAATGSTTNKATP